MLSRRIDPGQPRTGEAWVTLAELAALCGLPSTVRLVHVQADYKTGEVVLHLEGPGLPRSREPGPVRVALRPRAADLVKR